MMLGKRLVPPVISEWDRAARAPCRRRIWHVDQPLECGFADRSRRANRKPHLAAGRGTADGCSRIHGTGESELVTFIALAEESLRR